MQLIYLLNLTNLKFAFGEFNDSFCRFFTNCESMKEGHFATIFTATTLLYQISQFCHLKVVFSCYTGKCYLAGRPDEKTNLLLDIFHHNIIALFPCAKINSKGQCTGLVWFARYFFLLTSPHNS